MKQRRAWALVAIVALIAASAYVMIGTRTDAKTHQKVAAFPPKFGLDISGGVRAVLRARTDKVAPGVKYDQATVQRILENRINSSGVGEATVQPKGTDQFIVELPAVKNKNAILEKLGSTASMTFYYFRNVRLAVQPTPRTASNPILMDIGKNAAGHEAYNFVDQRTNQSFRDGAQIKADFANLLTEGTNERTGATSFAMPSPISENLPKLEGQAEAAPVFFTSEQQKRAVDLNRELTAWNRFLADSPPILFGADIEPKSQAQLGGGQGAATPAVTQSFTASGARKFSDFTSNHVGEIMGIVLDDAVISAPNIVSPITDGQGEISGGFADLNEAQSLANLLNAGALPVPLEQVQTQSVEASLGQGAVDKSKFAGLVGLGLVLLFMLLIYRLPGVIADIALLIYALFTFAIFKGGLGWLGVPVVTLTLPGIAGFILSIGMAVDANILIFERMKEELRAGKSLRVAIDTGFKRAFTAIRDSNICTAITCVVLLSLGTPSVKGFALTLLIGVAVSLFSAVFVTRTFLGLLVDWFPGLTKSPAAFGVSPASINQPSKPGLNIVGRRRFFYALSALIIVPGIIFWAMGGLKRSIEFTGGSQIEVKYNAPVTQAGVEKALTTAGFVKPHVQLAEGGTVAIASVRDISTVGNPAANPVHQKLTAALGTLGANAEQQFGNVGGVISAELTSRAFQAVVIASILIVLYLALVFAGGNFAAGLRLGASAIAALLHDVLVLIGVFAILGFTLGWEIDSLFVTALLTVIGFSVHDTVIIFDRVRENLLHRGRGESFETLVNRSINQTLARSLFTSGTVLLTLLSLILFGGQTTRLLNVALFIGILSGTYSSIFNAASILVDWENWLAKRRGTGTLATAATPPGPAVGGPKSFPSNGGTTRPLPTGPTAPRPKPAPTVTSAGTGDGFHRPTSTADASARAKPKKKTPRRF